MKRRPTESDKRATSESGGREVALLIEFIYDGSATYQASLGSVDNFLAPISGPSLPAPSLGNLEGRCLQRLEASETPLEPQATPLQPNRASDGFSQPQRKAGRFAYGPVDTELERRV